MQTQKNYETSSPASCDTHVLATNVLPTARLENWLDNFLNFEKLPQKNIFWLDTMQFLCAQFGHPEKCAPCIHVAGSKGKGSVSEMLASIIEESGYKCGLYQSPHITDFRERVRTAHEFFDDEIYEKATDELISGMEKIPMEQFPGKRHVTWFELVTLYAFLCFRLARVDFAVYEVGLGGRLDATNVIMPQISVITHIELEHTEYLGNTIEKIATEKAGIIKQGVPVIVGHQKHTEALKIIEQIAISQNSQSIFIDNLTTILGNSVPKLKMLGDFQKENATLASLTIKTVFPNINEDTINVGLSKAFLPGRFEIVKVPEKFPQPFALIFDGAHTVTSIEGAIKTLTEIFSEAAHHALFACAADKDIEHIAPLFSNKFSHITLTKPGAKSSDIEKTKHAFEKAGLTPEICENTERAFLYALEKAARENATLLVIGSFYLLSTVKATVKDTLARAQ